MSVHLKAMLYSTLAVTIVSLIFTGFLWLCLGGIDTVNIITIVVISGILSPRFDVISSQSGKTLKITGIIIMVYNAWKSWKKKKKI